MKRISILTLFFLFLGCWGAFAQELKVSYQVEKENGQYAMTILMQSATEAPLNIRAVNFSLSISEGCKMVARNIEVFETAWTDFLQSEKLLRDISLKHEDEVYTQRWQFGVAQPDLPGTNPITVPSLFDQAIPVLELTFEGTCEKGIYLEHVSENHLNQIGGGDFNPLDYTIEELSRSTETVPVYELSVVAYPNPVMDNLNIDFTAPEESEYLLELLDLAGRSLYSKEQHVEPGMKYEASFNVEKLPAATYVVRLSDLGTGVTLESVKVVKQ